MTTTITDFIAQLLGYIYGLQKHFAGQTLRIDSKDVTEAELVTTFQSAIDTRKAVEVAETQRTAAIAKAAAAMQLARPMAKGLKARLLATEGADTTMLADFQLKPHKVPVVTPEVKAKAAAKAAATRKALGTKGAAQKKAAKKALAEQSPPVAPPAGTPTKA